MGMIKVKYFTNSQKIVYILKKTYNFVPINGQSLSVFIFFVFLACYLFVIFLA